MNPGYNQGAKRVKVNCKQIPSRIHPGCNKGASIVALEFKQATRVEAE